MHVLYALFRTVHVNYAIERKFLPNKMYYYIAWQLVKYFTVNFLDYLITFFGMRCNILKEKREKEENNLNIRVFWLYFYIFILHYIHL